jgi:hypothetical protein
MSFAKVFAATFVAIAFSYFAQSCATTPVSPTPKAKTQTELLTGPVWRLDSVVLNGAITRTSLKAWKFNADGTGYAAYTTSSGPDEIDSTRWSFTNSAQTTFLLGSKSVPIAEHQAGTIESLTEKRFQTSFVQRSDRYIVTFIAQ